MKKYTFLIILFLNSLENNAQIFGKYNDCDYSYEKSENVVDKTGGFREIKLNTHVSDYPNLALQAQNGYQLYRIYSSSEFGKKILNKYTTESYSVRELSIEAFNGYIYEIEVWLNKKEFGIGEILEAKFGKWTTESHNRCIDFLKKGGHHVYPSFKWGDMCWFGDYTYVIYQDRYESSPHLIYQYMCLKDKKANWSWKQKLIKEAEEKRKLKEKAKNEF